MVSNTREEGKLRNWKKKGSGKENIMVLYLLWVITDLS